MNSLVSQSADGLLEIIVQDAHSTDETHEVLRDFEGDPRIKIFVEKDRGQSHAINLGISKSNGEILGWLNSDDVLLPDATEKVVEAYRSNPNAGLVIGEAAFIDEQDRVLHAYPTGEPNLDVMMHRCVISQPSCFFSRSSVEQYGLVREDLNYCMDYELWLRLLVNGIEPIRLSELLSCTRIHDQTKTSTGGLAFVEEILRMQREKFGETSPVWEMYERARSGKLAAVPFKSIRFGLAAIATFQRNPKFMSVALASFKERREAERRAREIYTSLRRSHELDLLAS